jgi:membrane protease YdiL (CAAX protease family)
MTAEEPQTAFDPDRPSISDVPARPAAVTAADRLGALVQVLLCSDVPTQALLAAVLTHLGLPPLDPAGRLSAAYVVTLSLVDTAVLSTLIVIFIRADGERPRDVFLGSRPIAGEAYLGLLLIPVALLFSVVAATVIRSAAPWLHNVPENPLEALITTPGLTILFVVVGIVAGGIREELQRAFILRRFEQYLGGGWLGLAIFSMAFGAGHAIQGWDAAVITGGLGLLWGALYLVRRSVIGPLVSHAGFNAAEILGFVALVD